MGEMLETRKYFLTVEGETERWYFAWLCSAINACSERKYNVAIDAKVQQSPMKYAKSINPKATPKVIHICDVESMDNVHVQKSEKILTELKDAKVQKKITYDLGYSNFTFELWIVLHRKNCNATLVNRTQYLPHINQAFCENFENLDQYKHEANFKRCLKQLTLSDVRDAIKRAKAIMTQNEKDRKQRRQYKGFTYYTGNPSLTIFEAVEEILVDCGLDH